MRVVTYDDIDLAQVKSQTVDTTELELVPSRLGKARRTQLYVINTSATTLTLMKGDNTVAAGTGIRLTQNQSWTESDDAGSKCWQGAVRAVASAASTVVFVETTEK